MLMCAQGSARPLIERLDSFEGYREELPLPVAIKTAGRVEGKKRGPQDQLGPFVVLKVIKPPEGNSRRADWEEGYARQLPSYMGPRNTARKATSPGFDTDFLLLLSRVDPVQPEKAAVTGRRCGRYSVSVDDWPVPACEPFRYRRAA